jgi:hypothetical protein
MIRGILKLFGWSYLPDESVLDIAKARCAESGWPWIDPVLLSRGPLTTMVTTSANTKGGNVRIVVDARTGVIRSAGYADR